jgi:hypothetical protein
MKKSTRSAFVCLIFALLVSACATKSMVEVPDTQPGDRLKPEYMVGNWCTNRELTGETNREAGHSQLTNISPRFWNFKQGGDWQVSASGWMYESHGSWKLGGRNMMVLKSEKGALERYQANFKNGGVDLFLEDDDGKFLVLSGCE